MDRADILKVDFKRTTLEERGAMIKRYGPWRCRMLAEKVETHEEFHLARNQGFLYFQGYFFRKPEIMTAHEIPANRINYLSVLQAVIRVELDLREVENVLKSEASLCYRLLRYMNSAVFGFGSEIHSVRHALSLIGEREIRRWVRLVAAVGAGQQKSSELVLCALTRARFCELLAPKVQHATRIYSSWACFRLWMSFSRCQWRAFWRKYPSITRLKRCLSAASITLGPFINSCSPRNPGLGSNPPALSSNFTSVKAALLNPIRL